MSQQTFTYTATLATVTANIIVPPGVLHYVMLHAHDVTIMPGDIDALIYLCDPADPLNVPQTNLDSGMLSTSSPLQWYGRFPIEVPMSLNMRLRGNIVGDFTLSYGRLTITSPHEIGLYDASLR